MDECILARVYLVHRKTVTIIVALFMERTEDDLVFNRLHVASAAVL